MLLDDQQTMERCGIFTRNGREVEIAALYPRRDEDGDVTVSEGGKTLLTIAKGTWDTHTTIRSVRERLEALHVRMADKAIVYNALSLPDASCFGQNEIHKGAVLFVV